MSTPAYRILLVEDDPADRERLLQVLSACHEPQVNVTHVDTVARAVRCIEGGTVDLVLLDISLPDAAGLDAFRTIFACDSDLPILILTDERYAQSAIEAVRLGAADYLVKSDLQTRQLVHAVRFLHGRWHRESGPALVARAREDSRIAREILFNLYPHTPLIVPGFDIAGTTFPADFVGADYFDYLSLHDNTVGLVIGDGAGHGLGPALLITQAQACLATLAQTTADPADMLTRANRILAERMPNSRFVTLLLVRLDPTKRTIEFVNAGHPHGLLFAPDGSVRKELTSDHFPLGIIEDHQYAADPPITMHPGEVLLLTTDGLFEAMSPTGERFGWERIAQAVQEHHTHPAATIIEALYDRVTQFLQTRPQKDDVTAVVIKAESTLF